MENTKERIQKLESEMYQMHRSWRLITAATWSEERWAQEEARDKEIKSELEQLIIVRKKELNAEQTELEGKYPKFSNRLKYLFFKVPAEVLNAEKRYNEIKRELIHLNHILK